MRLPEQTHEERILDCCQGHYQEGRCYSGNIGCKNAGAYQKQAPGAVCCNVRKKADTCYK